MLNIPKSVQRTANCLTVIIILLPVLLKFWTGIRDIVPLPTFINLTEKFVFITLASQIIFLPTLIISSFRIGLKISLWALSIPICLFFIILFLQSPYHIANSARVSEHNIYLVDFLNIPDAKTVYFLYVCDSNSLNCQEVDDLLLEGGTDLYKTELVVADSNIHVFANGNLKFTYGEESKNYRSTYADQVTLDGFDYGLAVSVFTNPKTIVLYRVKSDTQMNAEVLPFQYKANKYDDVELKVNEETKEVFVYIDKKLIFKYDSTR